MTSTQQLRFDECSECTLEYETLDGSLTIRFSNGQTFSCDRHEGIRGMDLAIGRSTDNRVTWISVRASASKT